MNSVTKIGAMALTKHFGKKPFFCKGKTIISQLVFFQKPIDLSVIRDTNYKSYKIWSIELGVLELSLKKDQSLYQGIVKKLNSLQKEDAPSHLIISERVETKNVIKGITSTITHTIYRLTEEQEITIFHDGLFPSIVKRADREQKKWEEWRLKWREEVNKLD